MRKFLNTFLSEFFTAVSRTNILFLFLTFKLVLMSLKKKN